MTLRILVYCLLSSALCAQSIGVEPATLTRIDQIKELTADEAAQRRAVRINAVVTFANQFKDCFVQDATGAIFVQKKPAQRLEPGTRVEIEGRTAAGDYAPIIVDSQIKIIAKGDVPEVRVVDFERVASGLEDCRLVEVSGIVRFTQSRTGVSQELQLASGGGKIHAYVYDDRGTNFSGLVDARVRVRGAVGGKFNQNRQFVAPLLFVYGAENVILEATPSENTTTIPVRPVSTLMQFRPGEGTGHRVKIKGVVTHQQRGQAVFLRDDTRGLRVQTAEKESFRPGDIVEVVGFPTMGAYSPMLQDATICRTGVGAVPMPVQTSAEKILEGRHDADLVTIEGQLLDVVKRADEQVLVLQAGNVMVSSYLRDGASGETMRIPQNGSKLRLTGISLVEEVSEKRSRLAPRSFRLLLRAPEDIVLLQSASWWTVKRLAGFMAVLGILALVALLWVIILRRRVRQQTAIIREKVQREAALQERTRIAREFHDTLEQELAGITMQLDTAAAQMEKSTQAAARHLEKARQMSRRSLIEAQRSVWDLRSRLLEEGDLASALKEITRPLTEGATVQMGVTVHGQPRRLSGVVETNVLRIGQEAVTNALKHANAQQVDIELTYDRTSIRLRVKDDGLGFEVNDRVTGSNGRFGLIGMRERAENIGGQLVVHSRPGGGTEIIFDLPQAAELFQPDLKGN